MRLGKSKTPARIDPYALVDGDRDLRVPGSRDRNFPVRLKIFPIFSRLTGKSAAAGWLEAPGSSLQRIRHRVAGHLEHCPVLWDHLMGQSGSFGQARRAGRDGGAPSPRWRASAATQPMRRSGPPKAGLIGPLGRVALLIRCPASHFEALPTTGQNNPGQMAP